MYSSNSKHGIVLLDEFVRSNVGRRIPNLACDIPSVGIQNIAERNLPVAKSKEKQQAKMFAQVGLLSSYRCDIF